MKTLILFLGALSALAIGASVNAQIPVRSDLAGSPRRAISDSSKPQLQLATEVIKETYCKGPDPGLVPLRLLLRLSFTNVGNQKLLLELGSKSVPVIRISQTAEDAIAKRYETTINNYIITDFNKAPKVLKEPHVSSFATLQTGEVYETFVEVDISVLRANPVPRMINPGSHYLQIGVWTWENSQQEAKLRRKQWRRNGFLWTDSVLSKPMLFTVRSQPKPEDCRCVDPNISENEAIEIARKRIRALGHELVAYKSVSVGNGCLWQVVFESGSKDREKPSFIFIIDKSSGKVLGEFQ